MKKCFTNNLGLKIMSLLIAFFLWVFLYNSSDPVGYRQMTIPITLKNEATLENDGLTYQFADDTTSVQVTIKAPLSVRNTLTESDLQVVADFSKMTAENTIALEASCNRYRNSIEEITLDHPTLGLSVEKLVTRQLTVNINVTGTPKDGYAVVDSSASPNRVTVSGPESLMEQLDSLEVSVPVDDVKDDFESTAKIRVCNSSGKVMDTSRMELSDKDVLASVSVEEIKALYIQIQTKGECAAGYGLKEVQLTPNNILVYGDDKVMKENDVINISSSQMDITGATGNVEKEINVASLLPEGLKVAQQGQGVVKAVAIIEKESSRSIKMPVSGLLQINVPAGYTVSFGNVTDITLPLTGLDSSLEAVTAESLKPTIDLLGLSEGTHDVNVSMTLPEGVLLGSKVQVQVILNKNTSQ